MSANIKIKPQSAFIGFAVRTVNGTQFVSDVAPLWEQLFKNNGIAQIPHRKNDRFLVVYTDYAGDYTQPFTYLLGCEVASLDTVPQGMRGLQIPKQSYQLFEARGSYPNALIETWQKIWNSSLPRAYQVDLEEYPGNFNPAGSQPIDIFIGVR